MISTQQAAIQQVGTFVLGCILIGGSIALAILNRVVPEWLIGFDGVAITAVYGNAQAFVQARTALPTATALSQAQTTVHALATSGTPTSNPTASGGSVTVPAPSIGGNA